MVRVSPCTRPFRQQWLSAAGAGQKYFSHVNVVEQKTFFINVRNPERSRLEKSTRLLSRRALCLQGCVRFFPSQPSPRQANNNKKAHSMQIKEMTSPLPSLLPGDLLVKEKRKCTSNATRFCERCSPLSGLSARCRPAVLSPRAHLLLGRLHSLASISCQSSQRHLSGEKGSVPPAVNAVDVFQPWHQPDSPPSNLSAGDSR